MQNHTHIHINGNHNTVNINQSNESNYINQSNESNYYNSGNSGCGCFSWIGGCFSWIGLIFLIGCMAPLCNRSHPYTPDDNQKWFEPVHGSHTNQINYRKSCQLCKDELCDEFLREHIDGYKIENYGRIHNQTLTKENCTICKINLKLSKTELKKIYSESQKSIQYIPIFFEEYPMIDNDIIPWGCRSIKWIEKQKAMTIKI